MPQARQTNGRATPKARKPAPPNLDIKFDPGKLTVGDLMDLEEHFGVTLDHLMSMVNGTDIRKLGTKTLAALAFLVKRHQDPEFPAADARSVSLEDLFALIGVTPAQAAQSQPAVRLAGKGAPVQRRPTPGG
jgi:hypothetical protein